MRSTYLNRRFVLSGARERPIAAAYISGCSGESGVMAGACSGRPVVVSAGPVIAWYRSGGVGRAAGAGPPGLAHLPGVAWQPACIGQRLAQQVLDLGVGAAQLVGGPAGQRVVHGGVQPQQDALALAHRVTVPAVTGTGCRC